MQTSWLQQLAHISIRRYYVYSDSHALIMLKIITNETFILNKPSIAKLPSQRPSWSTKPSCIAGVSQDQEREIWNNYARTVGNTYRFHWIVVLMPLPSWATILQHKDVECPWYLAALLRIVKGTKMYVYYDSSMSCQSWAFIAVGAIMKDKRKS